MENKCSEFVMIAEFPTQILKFGDLDQSKEKVLFVIIPGNPGIMEYYEDFMLELYERFERRFPVWGVSHTGHRAVDKDHPVSGQVRAQLFSLEDQISIEADFLEKHVPGDVKLILIGHSIGCYIILKLLQRRESLRSRLLRALLLFPTVERMASSPAGTLATPFLRLCRWLPVLLLRLATPFLSDSSRLRLCHWHFRHERVSPTAMTATQQLLQPACVQNVLHMANIEMRQVAELEENLLEPCLERLTLYYGQDDHWCPVSYHRDMRLRFPEADVRMCQHGYAHAFCLESGVGMAREVAEMCSFLL